jgi:hypothetical protein
LERATGIRTLTPTLAKPGTRWTRLARQSQTMGSSIRSNTTARHELNHARRQRLPAHQLFDVIRRAVRGVDQEHVHALQDITSGHSADTVAKKCCNRWNGRAELFGDASKAVNAHSE